MLNKYCRTLHFYFSPCIHDDDKVVHMKDLGNFLNKEYVILEKLDGQNDCLKGLDSKTNVYPGVFARTHAMETKLPWDHMLISWYHNNKYNLKNDTWYFLENLFAEHSIVYKNLDFYFFLFNLYNPLNNMFLSWDEVEFEAQRIGLKTPKVLFRGKFNSMSEVKQWMDRQIRFPSEYGDDIEGFVMRPVEAFNANDFTKVVGKYVRDNHVQTDEHWTKNWKQAKLLK